jgi:hypothetical protein
MAGVDWPQHLPWVSLVSGQIRDAVEKKLFPELNNVDGMLKKTFWFTSGLPINRGVEYNEFVSAVVATTNYFIWTAKLQKTFSP